MSEDEKKILQAHTDALNRNTSATERLLALREKELRLQDGQKKRERGRYKDWFTSEEVVERLRPFIIETEVLKQMREDGLFNMPGEGYHQQGRTYYYNPDTVQALRRRFQTNNLKPIRRK